MNLLSYKPYDEDGFFLLLVTPPVESAGQAVAKDVVLVMDTSGSIDRAKIVQARAAADYVLEHLGPDDRFNIVAFSMATRLFTDQPVPAAHGATRATPSCAAWRRPAPPTSTGRCWRRWQAPMLNSPVLIFLTDGLPTAGEVDPDRIAANIAATAPKAVRLFAFGVGYDVDTVLLDQLSSGQRGTSTYVKPEQDIEEEVSGFYAKVSAPVLIDVEAAFRG